MAVVLSSRRSLVQRDSESVLTICKRDCQVCIEVGWQTAEALGCFKTSWIVPLNHITSRYSLMIVIGTGVVVLVPLHKILKSACAKPYNMSAENCCS